jgi:SSS family solute:Na+ symporter
MTGVAFTVGALSNLFFFNETGKVALLAAGSNDSIIPKFISMFMPEWFGAIFLLTLLAAAMSTLSSQFHAMGTAIGRDVYEKGMGKKGNTIVITKGGILVVIILSTVLAWLSSMLEASMAIIATGTALFFGLCAATFLPAYIGALYIKTLSKVAAIGSMIVGFTTSTFWIFFVHKKESASLQLCKLIFGKPSIVDGTALSPLSMVDPIFIALPLSAIAILIFAFICRSDLEKKHIDKCFDGIG